MFNITREDWKSIRLGEGYTNETRLEISNHGRIRAFNKVSKGKIIKGSLINGYPIIRTRLFKPRDAKAAEMLSELQSIYLGHAKKVIALQKTMKALEPGSDDHISLNIELETETELLKKSKQKYNLRSKKDVKSRTVHFGALIHRLVAEYFLPRPSEDQTIVAHLDHDKLNNRLNNLKWMTPAENVLHQRLSPNVIADKEKRKKSGANQDGRSKLSVTKVMFLKKLLNEGKPIQSLAKQFKITETQIIRIKKQENWAEVEAAK